MHEADPGIQLPRLKWHRARTIASSGSRRERCSGRSLHQRGIGPWRWPVQCWERAGGAVLSGTAVRKGSDMPIKARPMGYVITAAGLGLSVLWAGFASAGCMPAANAEAVALCCGLPLAMLGAAVSRLGAPASESLGANVSRRAAAGAR